MGIYNYNISITAESYKRGLIYGEIDNIDFVAMAGKESNIYGINCKDLRSGNGRVYKLCVYRDIVEQEEMPDRIIFKTCRHIYAEYDQEGWKVLNMKYYNRVKELIEYLDNRYSFKIV
ncbi:MAG: hypothetical protein WC996_08465 [Peptostreptococcales bacterium]